MKVLNFGSLNYDYVYQVDHMIVEGETMNSLRMNTHFGGKGLNQSIAMAKAGVDVYQAGTVGEDGEQLLELLREHSVNTDYVRKIEGKSGHTIIQVDRDGKNCILLYGGSNRQQTSDYIKNVLQNFGEGDFVVLQNEINLLDEVIEKAKERGMKIVLNPSPYDEGLNNCDFHKVDYLLLNEIEGKMMTGFSDTEDILNCLKNTYPEMKVVLTLGKSGAYYQDKEKRVYQKSYEVKAVDTTAAGDTFTGYFISGLLRNMDIESVMKKSATASSITVTREGAAESIPTWDEVKDDEEKL